MRIIRFNQLVTEPWKNGGGITREIAALRERGQTLWRISMADVETNRPFSSFSGLTRILTVIEGNGIRLLSEDSVVEAHYGQPVQFEGSLAINSELIDGPIRDVNVIFDATLYEALVTLAEAPPQIKANNVTAIIGLTGTSIINGQNLQFGDTALIGSEAADFSFAQASSAIVVRLNRRQK